MTSEMSKLSTCSF